MRGARPFTPATRVEARSLVFHYIEAFYNPKRRHSALGYCSPIDFEQRFATPASPRRPQKNQTKPKTKIADGKCQH